MARAAQTRVLRAPEPVGDLVRRAVVALLLSAAGPLAAQRPAADSAWSRGDYARARALYDAVLAADSTDARAWHRLAILDAWDGKFERALARFARLRLLAPGDADVMVDEARTDAWAGRNAAGLALYDSVLARDPARADALAGRARAVAWSGDLERAEALWRDALAAHPDDAEILIGLAQTLYWKGQAALAETYVARARAQAPTDRAALELERQLAVELRPDVRTTLNGAGDSDGNDFWGQDASFTGSLDAARGTLQAGWRRATIATRAAASYGAGGGLQLGVYGRLLGYRHPRPGVYFAPDRFSVLEARAVYTWRRGQWGGRGDAGLGTQQVLSGGKAQSEWHLGLSLSREWWSNGEILLGGAITNSAASSTTGAFRYRSLTLSLRQGL